MTLIDSQLVHKIQANLLETSETNHKLTEFKGNKPNTQKYKDGDPIQRRFMDSLADMIAIDGLPMSFVEGRAFRQLISNLDPKIGCRSRRSVANHLNNKVANLVSNE